MFKEGSEDDDDSFVQVASKKSKRKGDGFDGFGSPDPFNRNDDDEVDAGEPNAPDQENPNDDPNMVKEGSEDDDDSFLQLGSSTQKAPEDELAKEMTHDLEMNFNKIAPFGKEDT